MYHIKNAYSLSRNAVLAIGGYLSNRHTKQIPLEIV